MHIAYLSNEIKISNISINDKFKTQKRNKYISTYLLIIPNSLLARTAQQIERTTAANT